MGLMGNRLPDGPPPHQYPQYPQTPPACVADVGAHDHQDGYGAQTPPCVAPWRVAPCAWLHTSTRSVRCAPGRLNAQAWGILLPQPI